MPVKRCSSWLPAVVLLVAGGPLIRPASANRGASGALGRPVALGAELLAVPATLTCPASAGLVMHVESISVGWTYAGGVKKRPNVRVRILDQYGVPVTGATVTGDWSGCFSLRGSSGVTGDLDLNHDGTITSDETGWTEITSSRTATCSSNQCYFTFAVVGVAQAGNTYDATQNVETSDFSKCNPFLP